MGPLKAKGCLSDDAQIKFACPHCGQQLEAPADMAGETVACPGCNRAILIPSPPAPRVVVAATRSAPARPSRRKPMLLLAAAVVAVVAVVASAVLLLGKGNPEHKPQASTVHKQSTSSESKPTRPSPSPSRTPTPQTMKTKQILPVSLADNLARTSKHLPGGIVLVVRQPASWLPEKDTDALLEFAAPAEGDSNGFMERYVVGGGIAAKEEEWESCIGAMRKLLTDAKQTLVAERTMQVCGVKADYTEWRFIGPASGKDVTDFRVGFIANGHFWFACLFSLTSEKEKWRPLFEKMVSGIEVTASTTPRPSESASQPGISLPARESSTPIAPAVSSRPPIRLTKFQEQTDVSSMIYHLRKWNNNEFDKQRDLKDVPVIFRAVFSGKATGPKVEGYGEYWSTEWKDSLSIFASKYDFESQTLVLRLIVDAFVIKTSLGISPSSNDDIMHIIQMDVFLTMPPAQAEEYRRLDLEGRLSVDLSFRVSDYSSSRETHRGKGDVSVSYVLYTLTPVVTSCSLGETAK